MADEFRELQSAVPGDFKHRVIELGRELLDYGRLATAGRPVNIERIRCVNEPDYDVPALLVKDVVPVNSRSERRRGRVALDMFA